MRYASLIPLLALSAAVIAVGTSHSVAQTSAPVVTCKDLVIPLGNLPADTVLNFTLTPTNLVQQCQSSSGSSLTLVSPKVGMTVNPKPNSQQSIPFTVQDSNGNQATANVVVTRK